MNLIYVQLPEKYKFYVNLIIFIALLFCVISNIHNYIFFFIALESWVGEKKKLLPTKKDVYLVNCLQQNLVQ